MAEQIEEIKDESILENVDNIEESNVNDDVNIVDNTKTTKRDSLDFSSINYKDLEKIDQEQIDLYYMLNDNKNNIEFLNEELVARSKREEEIKALKAQEKEEFDFQMEELIDNVDAIKVDLTGIIDDLNIKKE